MASLVKKKGTYYAVFSFNIKKKWLKIGNVNYKDARQILKKLELELELVKDRFRLQEIKAPTFYKFIEAYIDYTTSNKAPRTVRRELSTIKVVK